MCEWLQHEPGFKDESEIEHACFQNLHDWLAEKFAGSLNGMPQIRDASTARKNDYAANQ